MANMHVCGEQGESCVRLGNNMHHFFFRRPWTQHYTRPIIRFFDASKAPPFVNSHWTLWDPVIPSNFSFWVLPFFPLLGTRLLKRTGFMHFNFFSFDFNHFAR